MTLLRSRWPGVGVQAMLFALAVYGLISAPGLAMRWGVSPLAAMMVLLWAGSAALGLPLLKETPSRRWLLLLWGSLVVLRCAVAVLGVGHSSTGDPAAYLNIAKGMLHDHLYGFYDPFFGSYWRAMFPPLYPALLAGWGWAFGFSTESLLTINTLIDLAAAWLVWRIGTRLGNAGAGRAAAWLYLIWPSALFSAGLAQKESLCALLVLALALAWLGTRPGRWRDAVIIGALAGLLALTQPGEAPLAGLFGCAMLLRIGLWPVVLTGLRALSAAIVVMLPWWIRNALVLGAFVPLTTSGGASLWIGNNPDATGNWLPPPPELKGQPELIYGKHIAAIAWTWIVDHPAGFVRITLEKLLRACGVGEFGVVRLAALSPPLPAIIAATLWPLSHGAHLVMLVVAGIGSRARSSPGLTTLVLLVVACIAQWLLFGVWFEFGERHREFATPFLLLLGCWRFAAVGKPVATS